MSAATDCIHIDTATVPERGVLVHLEVAGSIVWLEPSEAAQVADTLIRTAEDAVNAERSGRRS